MTDVKTDEELVEDIKKWWKENGRSVVVGIAVGLSIIFGWRSWQNYQEVQAFQASDQYSMFTQALKLNEKDQAKLLLDAIQKEYPNSPYSVYASMDFAKHNVLNADFSTAKTHLNWALEHAKLDQTKELIQLRLARLLINENELSKATTLLNNVQDFAAIKLELEGDIALLKGDKSTARARYLTAKEKGVADNQFLQMKIDDLTPAI